MKITIIGAGTAGLASAILMARQGHEVEVFDKTENPGPVGAGILVQPSGKDVLQSMGLLAPLHECSQEIDALRGFNKKLETITLLPYKNQMGLGVHRGNLFKLLLDTATNENVRIQFGAPISKIVLENNRYRIPEVQEEASDLLILAQGPNPELLEQTDIPFTSKVYPWGALWHIGPTSQKRRELQQYYRGTSIFIGLLAAGLDPIRKQPCESFFWSIALDQIEAWKKQSLQDFKSQVINYWPECEEVMSSIEDKEQLLIARYRDTVLKRPYSKNLVVLGDAAHAMSPQLGQGVSLALQDAHALSSILSEDINKTLQKYFECRKKQIDIYQKLTRWLTPLYQSHMNYLAPFRDASISLGMKVPYIRNNILEVLSGKKEAWL